MDEGGDCNINLDIYTSRLMLHNNTLFEEITATWCAYQLLEEWLAAWNQSSNRFQRRLLRSGESDETHNFLPANLVQLGSVRMPEERTVNVN